MWHLVLLAFLLALVVFLVYRQNAPPAKNAQDSVDLPVVSGSDKPLSELLKASQATCYGAEWCGFTKKQQAELDDVSDGYEYVDCEADKERCTQAGINAFPTWEINGKKHEGFMSKERLQQLCS